AAAATPCPSRRGTTSTRASRSGTISLPRASRRAPIGKSHDHDPRALGRKAGPPAAAGIAVDDRGPRGPARIARGAPGRRRGLGGRGGPGPALPPPRRSVVLPLLRAASGLPRARPPTAVRGGRVLRRHLRAVPRTVRLDGPRGRGRRALQGRGAALA